MELDLKPFIDALRVKDTKKAREWLEQNRVKFDQGGEFERGYLLAMQGMVVALETGSEQAVIKRFVDGEYGGERIEELVKEARGRLSQKFRPKDERGFDTAWIEVIKGLRGERD